VVDIVLGPLVVPAARQASRPVLTLVLCSQQVVHRRVVIHCRCGISLGEHVRTARKAVDFPLANQNVLVSFFKSRNTLNHFVDNHLELF